MAAHASARGPPIDFGFDDPDCSLPVVDEEGPPPGFGVPLEGDEDASRMWALADLPGCAFMEPPEAALIGEAACAAAPSAPPSGAWCVGRLGEAIAQMGLEGPHNEKGVPMSAALAAGVINIESSGNLLPVQDAVPVVGGSDPASALPGSASDSRPGKRQLALENGDPEESIATRRRMNGKQSRAASPPRPPAAVRPQPAVQFAPPQTHTARDKFAASTGLERHAWIQDITDNVMRAYKCEISTAAAFSGKAHRDKRLIVKRGVVNAGLALQMKLAEWLKADSKDAPCPVGFDVLCPDARIAPADFNAAGTHLTPPDQELVDPRDKKTPRCRAVILTYQGKWGAARPEVRDLMHSSVPLGALKRLVNACRFYAELWEDFKKFAAEVAERFCWPQRSLLMEITMRRADEANLVHFHLVLSDIQRPHRQRNETTFGWRDSTPHIVFGNHRSGAGCARACNELHYYCQAPKWGALRSASNYLAQKDFPVLSKFIFHLWQKGKMSHEAAVREVVVRRCRDHISLCASITAHQQRMQVMLEGAAQAAAGVVTRLRPFKVIPEVVQWKAQFESGFLAKTRFSFLVLVGDSKYGKTTFAKSLFGPGATLVVECQNAVEPPLRNFDRSRHRAICFDEGTSKFVVQNKSVFQAGIDATLLGQSKTNSLSYSVWLHGVALIVSTNSWLHDVTPSEADWLRKNSLVVEVTDHMWFESELLALEN